MSELNNFKETIEIRAALAKKYLDEDGDGIVDWNAFRNIVKESLLFFFYILFSL